MADVGSLSIDATSVVQGAPIVFTYSVPADHASDTNWIGIWAADGGGAPVDGEYVASQITYQYSPGTSGSVTISSGLLPPGIEYVAYYLYNDGYTSLATPVLFTVNVGKQLPPPRFRDDFGRHGRIRLDSPVGMTLDERGRFWVADTGSRDVRVFNRRGHGVGVIGQGVLREPEDVAVFGGRAFVADADRNTVTVFDQRGRHLGEIGQGDVELPRGVDRRRQRTSARRRRRQQPGRGLRPEDRRADHVDHRRDPHPLRLLRGREPHVGGVVQPPVRR